jgi:hypothetical protein
VDILTLVLGLLTVSFAIAYSAAMYKIKQLTEAFAKVFIGQAILEDYLSSRGDSGSKTDEDIHKENFIKFLSDSREWAFSYIEEVQNGLKKFIDEVEPDIVYYNNFGSAVEGMIAPHDKALKKISSEFQELKKLLPEELNDRR